MGENKFGMAGLVAGDGLDRGGGFRVPMANPAISAGTDEVASAIANGDDVRRELERAMPGALQADVEVHKCSGDFTLVEERDRTD